jgi:hypothetical protein
LLYLPSQHECLVAVERDAMASEHLLGDCGHARHTGVDRDTRTEQEEPVHAVTVRDGHLD